MAHDVFISYSSKDKVVADAVCARLEARGIRCWIAPRDVRPGAPYGEEIIDGIHGARVMVLVLTASANASPHIPKEVERAVSRGVSIIPLRVEDVLPAKSLDYFISSVHWLDAITPPLESHLESLATTIRTLLPEESQKSALHLDDPAAGPQETATVSGPATASATRSKPTWLLPAAAMAVLALAAAGWFFLGKAPSTSSVSPPGATLPAQPAANPSPMARVQPGNAGQGATSPVSGYGDPIIGCWHWMNNATVVINADGSMTAGPFVARWRVVNGGRRTYNFIWPEAVDAVTLSPDGGGLSGGNQYGVAMTAARVAPGQDIAGTWRWYNGVIVNILPNGTFSAGSTRGRWQMSGPDAYHLVWPNPVDTVTLSADHRRVSGANQYGFPVSGTKTSACGG